MAYGKELRVPLLDHNIAEILFSVENEKLIKNGVLRDYYRNFILKKFKYNKFIKQKKYYVSDPQTKWLKTSLYDWAYSTLSSKTHNLDGLIDSKKLINYLNNFKKNDKIKNSNFIWQLLNIEYLLKKHKGN